MDSIVTALIFLSISSFVFLATRRLTVRSQATSTAVSAILPVRTFGPATGQLARLIPQFEKQREKLSCELVAAGYYHSSALDNFLAKRNVVLMFGMLLAVSPFTIGLADGRELHYAVGGSVALIAIYSLPRIILSGLASRRIREIEKSIPDALDMLAITIAGGIPLSDAIGRVAEQMHDTHSHLSQELKIISRQSQSGSIDQAFASFSKRIDLPEVIAWCSLIRQAQRLGGRMVDSLTDYANRIRDDRKNRIEKAGNIASIKLLLPVVTCLAPPIGVLLIGPALLDFRDFIHREKDLRGEVAKQLDVPSDRASSVTP